MKKYIVIAVASLVCLTACQSTTTNSSQDVSNKGTVSSSTIDWNQAGPDAKKHQLTFEKVKKEVEANQSVFYDVRSEAEYREQNFGITENYPISKLEEGIYPDIAKDTKIYVHCLKGIRSAQATQMLRDAGFTNVYDMGGIEHVQVIGGVLK